MMKICYFDRFWVEMPAQAVKECSHSGDCDADVDAWLPEIVREESATPINLRKELSEYGAWDDEELADDAQNWKRIVWIAAGNIQENDRENLGSLSGT